MRHSARAVFPCFFCRGAQCPAASLQQNGDRRRPKLTHSASSCIYKENKTRGTVLTGNGRIAREQRGPMRAQSPRRAAGGAATTSRRPLGLLQPHNTHDTEYKKNRHRRFAFTCNGYSVQVSFVGQGCDHEYSHTTSQSASSRRKCTPL